MEDADHQESEKLVSAEQFALVDVEAPIRVSKKVDCWSLGNLYVTAALKAKECDNEPAFRVFSLLSSIAKFNFKPEDQSEPYGPMFVFDGKRHMIPADLRGEQSAVIAELVPTIRNLGLRARLADIVWYNDRKLAAMAEQAIDAYSETVQSVLDGKAGFFDEDWTASSKEGCNLLRRACQIALATGRKEPGASKLKSLVNTVILDAIRRQDHNGFLNVGEIALNFGIDDPTVIATNAEKFAKSNKIDYYESHDLWELAAQTHRQTGNKNDRDRCLNEAAETHVAIADANDGRGMIAASYIMDAIKALQQLPDTQQRRHELKEKLIYAQSSVREEMSVISTQFDITEYVEYAQKNVSGITLAQALRRFAGLTRSRNPDELRDETLHIAGQNPILSMLPSTHVDEDGKVIAKSPGSLGDAEDCDLALRHLIVQNENLRRHIDVQGLIEPARQRIQFEHPIDRCDLRSIVEMTPFVPADRVDLVTTGLTRFFGGDFFSALHILVPQLEHSLRHILKLYGVEPSSINSDMTQQSRTLSSILNRERKSLEEILGTAIVFEIENLFDFRGGPALRHELAHGLITDAQCNGSDSIYACWFIYRLCCLPLYPHWHHIDQRLEAT